jgi:hypothetical protein
MLHSHSDGDDIYSVGDPKGREFTNALTAHCVPLGADSFFWLSDDQVIACQPLRGHPRAVIRDGQKALRSFRVFRDSNLHARCVSVPRI